MNDEAALLDAMSHYDTRALPAGDYIVHLFRDGQPVLDARGELVAYRNRAEASVDMLRRARADVAAALPDDGSGDDIGDPDDPSGEGRRYDAGVKVVAYAAA